MSKSSRSSVVALVLLLVLVLPPTVFAQKGKVLNRKDPTPRGVFAGELIIGVTTANVLIAFNSSAPGSAFGSLPITGLQSGENVPGIDFRPLTRQLYALGSTSRVYRINLTTGAATVVGGQFRTITLASPLANGAGINVNFTLLIFQAGTFRFFVNVEALP